MLEKLLKNRQIKRLIVWLQQTVFLGGTVSLYDILVNLVRSNRKYDIDQRASAVAYSLTLALFPAVIFLFTLIPYIPIEHLDQQIMDLLRENLPSGIYDDADQTIMDIISRPRSGVLSFGFIFAMIASTNGMMSLMRSFDMVYDDNDTRGFLKLRGIATLLTLLLIVVLFVSIILLIVGDGVMHILSEWNIVRETWMISLLNITRYLISFGSLMLTISMIYRYAPSHGRQFSFINAGAIISSVLIMLATYGFSFYLSRFSSYNKLYGSIGTMIALMIWLYLLAFVIILGFEINAGINTAARAKTIGKR
ncbi:YihY/virulence factor BrkB family protein [Dyadobacter fanqingshengii]|uniref:YihY/virulence factor BrkB family protein n=1 Tax=Dyadobacter fanqingshengii TaxID=2906443 RepID=A0A9X1T931_9BACT|nr:YihY/virulence factor BrkB family protein [Dyadobacter fanqingshengii]MCF0039499.1 YihY/virulence factor BrkB family protein [Dyadobacter fanqingshengii]MCF2502961.1 YihY/virulence factor BrkB family protein [Dyadobacter fanqingshengii]USJ33692.1 YihY/virulence factor BrkB family protein [Dyadobacter fanqingshengii]